MKATTLCKKVGSAATIRARQPDVRAAPRFEAVEVEGRIQPARDAVDQPQPGALDAPRVVIHPGQVGLLRPVDPEGQLAVVGPGARGRLPVDFERVRRVRDREPAAARPAAGVVQQPRPHLVAARIVAELDPQTDVAGVDHNRTGSGKSLRCSCDAEFGSKWKCAR